MQETHGTEGLNIANTKQMADTTQTQQTNILTCVDNKTLFGKVVDSDESSIYSETQYETESELEPTEDDVAITILDSYLETNFIVKGSKIKKHRVKESKQEQPKYKEKNYLRRGKVWDKLCRLPFKISIFIFIIVNNYNLIFFYTVVQYFSYFL